MTYRPRETKEPKCLASKFKSQGFKCNAARCRHTLGQSVLFNPSHSSEKPFEKYLSVTEYQGSHAYGWHRQKEGLRTLLRFLHLQNFHRCPVGHRSCQSWWVCPLSQGYDVRTGKKGYSSKDSSARPTTRDHSLETGEGVVAGELCAAVRIDISSSSHGGNCVKRYAESNQMALHNRNCGSDGNILNASWIHSGSRHSFKEVSYELGWGGSLMTILLLTINYWLFHVFQLGNDNGRLISGCNLNL